MKLFKYGYEGEVAERMASIETFTLSGWARNLIKWPSSVLSRHFRCWECHVFNLNPSLIHVLTPGYFRGRLHHILCVSRMYTDNFRAQVVK